MSEDGGSIRVSLQLSEEEAQALLLANLTAGGGENVVRLTSAVLVRLREAAWGGLTTYRTRMRTEK